MDDNAQDPNTTNDTKQNLPSDEGQTQQPAEEQITDNTETAAEKSDNQASVEPEITADSVEPEPPDAPGSSETEVTAKQESEDIPAEGGVIQGVDAATEALTSTANDVPGSRWYVVHTYSGHENRVATTLKQRVESEHLENKILDILVPTQEKIEIRSGKKETVKEKIFPGYILVKMVLDDMSWLAVRTTQGVTAFIGMGQKPTPISEAEVKSIVNFMSQGGQPTYKQIFVEGDTVKIVDGPFTEFIGKVDSVDKERGKVKVLVSIFGRETPVELDFLQVNKL